ncbi:MAG: prepilin-type N-terminal cleavage/methylation domain-containing protein [Candidatus Eisenbacteria bacterium]|nr:prepilin-type N-terminal cleavage/methylation domain-containing protein [Candidatus Eisenbacteria bacterium]
MRPTSPPILQHERGMTLIEMLIALVVLALGILAVGKMFPLGASVQNEDRLSTAASGYAEQKLEDVENLSWSDPALTDGRHPAGTATESLGGGAWTRFYDVSTLASPLDNIKRVIVTVNWNQLTTRSMNDTLYVRK